MDPRAPLQGDCLAVNFATLARRQEGSVMIMMIMMRALELRALGYAG
jgi:hypothetical protein